MTREHLRNESEFDCRRYVLPGDRVLVNTTKSPEARMDPSPMEGVVLAAYEQFVVVKLKNIVDSINRWNILKVNDRPIGSSTGWFGGMAARA